MTKRGRGRPPGVTAETVRSVALDLFVEHGYDSVPLTQIARAAGVSRTTLFAMYPAKRDIVWVDHELRSVRLRDELAAFSEGTEEALIRAFCAVADYRVDEHDLLVRRYSLVAHSAELQAYSSLQASEIADEITEWVSTRHAEMHHEPIHDGPDRLRVERVVQSLMVVASGVTEEWALSSPELDLAPYLAEQLLPFVNALVPILPERLRK